MNFLSGIFNRKKAKRFKSYQDEVDEIQQTLYKRRMAGVDKGNYVQLRGIKAFEQRGNPFARAWEGFTDLVRNVSSNSVPVHESYDFDEYGNSKHQGKGLVLSLLYNWATGQYKNRLVVQKSLQNYSEYKKMYNSFGMVKNAVDSLLMVARDMKWRIVPGKGNEQLAEAIERWLKRHNFDMKFHTILHRALVNGEIWYEIIRDKATEKVVKLKEMPVETMFVILNQRGRFIRYEQRLEGAFGIMTAARKPISFTKRQMLHLKFMSQHGEAYGTSAMHAALPDLYAFEEVMERLMELVNMTTYPLVHFAAESKASQEQLLKALPKQQRTGDIITGKDVEVKMIGFQGQVIDLIPYLKFLRESAVMSMGVPMAFLGLGEGTNKATLQIQQGVVQNRTESYLAELGFQLRENLFPLILEEENLVFEAEDIPNIEFHNVSVYDEREQQAFYEGQYKNGTISWKELRTKLGMSIKADFDSKVEEHPAMRVAPPKEGGQQQALPAKAPAPKQKQITPPPRAGELPPTSGQLDFPAEQVLAGVDLKMGWLPGVAPLIGVNKPEETDNEVEIENIDQHVPGFSDKSETLRKAMAKVVVDMRIIQRSLDGGNVSDAEVLMNDTMATFKGVIAAYKKWLDEGNSGRMMAAPIEIQLAIMDVHDQVKRISLRLLDLERKFKEEKKKQESEETVNVSSEA